MFWEIVSSTGEWAGAIAVVASLLYLARQIKLSNMQSRAAARYALLEAYNQVIATLSTSKTAASVFRRGLQDVLEDPDEEMQFMAQLSQALNTWSVFYDLHEENLLPGNQWRLVESDIHANLGTPGGRKFWGKIGRANTHSSFVAHVDKLLENEELPYQAIPDDI